MNDMTTTNVMCDKHGCSKPAVIRGLIGSINCNACEEHRHEIEIVWGEPQISRATGADKQPPQQPDLNIKRTDTCTNCNGNSCERCGGEGTFEAQQRIARKKQTDLDHLAAQLASDILNIRGPDRLERITREAKEVLVAATAPLEQRVRDLEQELQKYRQAVATALADKSEVEQQLESAWQDIESGYEIEPRAFFEKEAAANGFRYPLLMALHYIWKRDEKVDRVQKQLEVERAQWATELAKATDQRLAAERERDFLKIEFQWEKANTTRLSGELTNARQELDAAIKQRHVFADSADKLEQRLTAAQARIAELEKQLGESRKRLLSAAGDDLCRLSQEEINAMTDGAVPIPPKDEFIASCEKFHAQVAGEARVNQNCLTLAQLVAENEKQRQQLATVTAERDVIRLDRDDEWKRAETAEQQLESINALAREYGYGQGEIDDDLALCVRKIVAAANQREQDLATAQAHIVELERELEQNFTDHRRIDEQNITTLRQQVLEAQARIAELEQGYLKLQDSLQAERDSLYRERQNITALRQQVALLRAALGDPKELFDPVQRILAWCRDYGATHARPSFVDDVQALADHGKNCVIAAEHFDAQQEKPHDQ